MMDDIDATERGEVRTKPTTAQDALNIYKRNLEIRAKDKDCQYAHNVPRIVRYTLRAVLKASSN